MTENVETPMGQKTVLKPEELESKMKGCDISKYIKQEDGTYKCQDCGETILTARIAHPVWDGPFPLSGGGECQYEEMPFCPKCGQEPNCNGSPIAPKGSYHNP